MRNETMNVALQTIYTYHIDNPFRMSK